MNQQNESSQQPIYPLLPVLDTIVMPSCESVLIVGRSKSLAALQHAVQKDNKIVIATQLNSKDQPGLADLNTIGVIATIERVNPGERGETQIMVKGLEKVVIGQITSNEPYLEVEVAKVDEVITDDSETQALVHHIAGELKRAINMGKTLDLNFMINVLYINNAYTFSYQVLSVLDLKLSEKYKIFQINDLKERLLKLSERIAEEIKVLEIEQNISKRTSEKIDDTMRENILREKMKTIEEELGGSKGAGDKGAKDLKDKLKAAKMPKDIEDKVAKEIRRLEQMSQFNPESSSLRSYIETVVELPWNVRSPQNIDIGLSRGILDEDHYGLPKVKERILEYLAVLKLHAQLSTQEESPELQEEKEKVKKKKATPIHQDIVSTKERQPNILCFVGPPGVGKTSIGRSIAKALSTRFVKVSLGGVRDEAEIRGHRRTYVGSMPGRFIKAIKQAGVKNPVFMLDEIDKIGNDYRGDPASALLELLDPEQNGAFEDHYLELPFDMSEVFFITTANQLDTIPPALLDRLEVIHFAGYTEDEKYNIAKKYLVPKQLEAAAVSHEQVSLPEETIREIIRKYTREAGVRNIEREIANMFRKVAAKIVEGIPYIKSIPVEEVPKYLGVPKYLNQMVEDVDYIGISTGLAWTQSGGDILFIEVTTMPGKGNLTLTGNLGDVMKESCQAALSYVRSHSDDFGLASDLFSKMDIHVHVPEGATPKDGPSAGAAITTAMVSALTKKPVDKYLAMTGEITLRGRITEIGGIKEKVLAANRAGIKKVLLPEGNKRNFEEDIPSNIKDVMEFVFVQRIEDVLKEALQEPKSQKKKPATKDKKK
ncbi:endopeptidase La [Candidatus Woesebacteria bacterium]|nr:endopeptidase La [Candidatus Woesebacteria bacterium]